jgi:hypothetical protein
MSTLLSYDTILHGRQQYLREFLKRQQIIIIVHFFVIILGVKWRAEKCKYFNLDSDVQ